MNGQKDPPLSGHRWIVFWVLSAIYFLVYFHRVSTSVLVPYLMEAFKANATEIGILSSTYFYFYGLEQPLVGILVDRLGPRKVVTLFTAIAFLGSLIFSVSETLLVAAVGRSLIGIGVGGVYVPSMKAFAIWFREREFATVTGFLLSVGNLGGIAAATPLAWTAKHLGWPAAFQGIALATLFLCILCWFSLKDPQEEGRQEGHVRPDPRRETKVGRSFSWGLFGSILSRPIYWLLSVLFFTHIGNFLTFSGLWVYPFLVDVLSFDGTEASNIQMMLPIGFLLGAPITGYLADRLFRNRSVLLVVISGLLIVIWMLLCGVEEGISSLSMGLVLFFMGFLAGGFASGIWSFVRSITPGEILGTMTGLLNPAPFAGVTFFQIVTGYVLDLTGKVGTGYPPEAYRNAFLISLGMTVLAFGLSLFLTKTGRKGLSWP